MPKTNKRLGKQKNDKILEKGKMAILHRLYGQNGNLKVLSQKNDFRTKSV